MSDTIIIKERPIIFSGDMVNAILNGRKTQTRRVIKPQPGHYPGGLMYGVDGPGTARFVDADYPDDSNDMIRCSYGKPSDQLWVRETFWGAHETEWDEAAGSSIDHGSNLSLGREYHSGIDYVASPTVLDLPKCEHLQTINKPKEIDIPGEWWLGPPDNWNGRDEDHRKRGQWEFLAWDLFTKHSSIHMPRWASRINLLVKDIRVERVQDISYQDAINEGIAKEWDGTAHWYKNYRIKENRPNESRDQAMFKQHPRASFQTLWDSLNAKRGYSWDSNPWVWVMEFEMINS